MRIVLATRNRGKVGEMRALLADLPVDLLAASDMEGIPEVVEDAPTLEGNAAKKARVLHACTGLPALADDTGLEVDALDGRPGVYAAHYAGEGCTPADNRRLLLRELRGEANRTAQFRCVLAFVEGGREQFFEGVCRGHIPTRERGGRGFGYDPVFVPEGYAQTFAELYTSQKNAISHRALALGRFRAFLCARLF